MKKIRVAGYAKLAKLWEKNREQAISFHRDYFEQKYNDNEVFELVGVYVDITGAKDIKKRPEMIRLISDCIKGNVDEIVAQTKGYLAANTKEFCFLIKYLFELSPPVNIKTDDLDYNINTLVDFDNQRAELYRMAQNYIKILSDEYEEWKEEIEFVLSKL